MTTILFIDEHNAVHSQIAECICKFLGGRIAKCDSAGIHPTIINPETIKRMNDIYQVDLSQYVSKSIDSLNDYYDIVILINTDLQIDAGYVEKWNFSEIINDDLVYAIEEKIMFLLHEIRIGDIE